METTKELETKPWGEQHEEIDLRGPAILIRTGFTRGNRELLICTGADRTENPVFHAGDIRALTRESGAARCQSCDKEHEVFDVLTAFRTQQASWIHSAAHLTVGAVLALALQESVHSSEGFKAASKPRRRSA